VVAQIEEQHMEAGRVQRARRPKKIDSAVGDERATSQVARTTPGPAMDEHHRRRGASIIAGAWDKPAAQRHAVVRAERDIFKGQAGVVGLAPGWAAPPYDHQPSQVRRPIADPPGSQAQAQPKHKW
jgi:hypothetical protein